jgi:deoxyhypusine monooxygenase
MESCLGFDGKSALLGHELAYCLGQIGDTKALPILQAVLEDEAEHTMVRHEVSPCVCERVPSAMRS